MTAREWECIAWHDMPNVRFLVGKRCLVYIYSSWRLFFFFSTELSIKVKDYVIV